MLIFVEILARNH